MCRKMPVKPMSGIPLGIPLEMLMATTRYPKQGKGSRWTELGLKAIPSSWKGDYVADGEGLTGEVRVSSEGQVSINFKYGYKWRGAGAKHYCGT
jgi:hypothetical protein